MASNELSWIHISDLHVFAEVDTNILLEDCKSLAERISPDFMIITGDYRHIKIDKTYVKALNLLPKILDIFGLKRKDVFMVPGNHDVSATMKTTYKAARTRNINKIVAAQKASASGNYNALAERLYDGSAPLINAFDEYSSFVKEFYRRSGLRSNDKRLASPERVFCVKWNNRINIIHINTALISNDNREHKQICDIDGLFNCTVDEKLPTIMIGHHNLNDIYEAQVERILRFAEMKNISAYFSGDIHKFESDKKNLRTPCESLACYSCPKSVPQAGDSYSNIGLMYYTWKRDPDNKVDVEAYEWKIGKGFLPNNDYLYDAGKKDFFIIKTPKEKSNKPMAEEDFTITRKYVDAVAQIAYDCKQSISVANAILLQDNKNNSKHRTPSISFDSLYDSVVASTHKYPLIISGRPGTGKSTLLSLLYLRLHDDKQYWTYYLDLQSFDEKSNAFTNEQLEKDYRYINDCINKFSKVILFIDGLNEYTRLKPQHEQKLRNHMNLWQGANNVQIVCSIGTQDTDHYPPFIHFVSKTKIEAEVKIELVPVDTSSVSFTSLTNAVLEFRGVYTRQDARKKEAKQKHRDIINYCNLLDGGKSTFRSVLFLVDRCNNTQEDMFSKPVAILLRDYFYSFLRKDEISKIASEAADFLMKEQPSEQKRVKLSSYCLKSDAFLDFFFALSYLNFLTRESAGMIPSEELRKYNSIFTARINRFVVQLVCSDRSLQEDVLYSICANYKNMPIKAKNQAVYILGRLVDKEVKALAEEFLLQQFNKAYNEYPLSDKSNDEVMLLRSIGISLLKLGCRKHEDAFYELLIFDENMSRINRHFHITYYMNGSYKLTDEDVVNNSAVSDYDNIKRTYNFLYHSLEVNENPNHKCVNIITIIDLVLNYIYDSKSKKRNSTVDFDDFKGLINKFSNDVTLVNSVVKRYVVDLNVYLESDDPYIIGFSQIYKLKEQLRKGWTDRAIDTKQRTESVADHVWACCMLAQMLLPENIHDSNLIDKEECSPESEYNKQKVISLLLVHDLPESITGDIPSQKKTEKDKVAEQKAIATIGTLAAFPSLSPVRSVVMLWQESERESINAQLAYDIDKLEPLIQLYLYRGALAVPNDYSVASKWVSSLKLKTKFGLNLLRLIESHFINPDAFKKESSDKCDTKE